MGRKSLKQAFLFALLLATWFQLVAGTYPEVFTTSPGEGDARALPDGLIKVFFNQHMSADTVKEAAFSLTDQYGGDLSVSVIYDDERKCALVKPRSRLDWNTQYTLIVAGYLLKSQLGYPMKINHKLNFRTVPEVEPVSGVGVENGIIPKVIMTHPMPNAEQVPLNTDVAISFNKHMLPSSLNKFTVVLFRLPDRAIVPGGYRWLSDSKKLYFKPEKLEEGCEYQLEIKEGIRDLQGVLVSNPTKLTFRTIDLTAPGLVKLSPPDGAQEVSSGTRIVFEFSEELDMETIKPSNVFLTFAGKRVPVQLEYDNRYHSLELRPADALDAGEYQAVIKGLKDLSGNEAGEKLVSFTVAPDKDRTPPQLLRTLPENGATGVISSAPVKVWLSEKIKPETVNGLNVSLQDCAQEAPVKARIDYFDDDLSIHIQPLSPLDWHTEYTVVMSSNITDMSGNFLNRSVFSFVTGNAPDISPPKVERLNFSDMVPCEFFFEVEFNEPLKAGLISESTVILRNESGNVTGEVTLKLPSTVCFQPTTRLPYETEYTLTVFCNDISDLYGNKPESNFSWSVCSEERPDKTPPALIRSYPEHMAKDVPVQAKMALCFDEALNAETVGIYSVLLYRDDETLLCDVSYHEDKNEIQVSPRSELRYQAQYNLVVTEGVSDRYGNKLEKPISVRFSTECEPDRIQPVVLFSSPVNGAVNVRKDALISVKFSEPLKPASLTGNVKMQCGEGVIPLSLEYNPMISKLLVTPGEELLYGRMYTLKLDGKICDPAGNGLPEEREITFTVEMEPDRISPEIIAQDPHKDSRNVPIGSSCRLIFSEPLADNTVNEFTVYLEDTEALEKVRGQIRYLERERAVEFIPRDSLVHDRRYCMVVSQDLTDVAGNRMQNLERIEFSTEKAPDGKRPEVVRTIPADSASDIEIRPAMRVDFSEPINEMTLNEFTVRLTDEEGVTVPLDLKYNRLGNHLLATIGGDLRYASKYSLVISPTVEDLARNCLASTKIIGFRTQSEPDTVPPLLEIIDPADKAEGVPVNARISAIFSEELEDKSVNRGNVIIKKGKSEIEVEVAHEPAFRKVTVIPLKPFEFDSEYFVYFTTGLRDTAGNRFGQTRVVSFRTAMRPDTERPEIVRTVPDAGDSGVAIKPMLLSFFSEPIDGKTISSNTVTLSDGTIYIPGSLNFDRQKNCLEFVPVNALEYNRTYHFIITDGLRDLAGNPLSGTTIVEFTTRIPPDMVPPRLVNYQPAAGSTGNVARQEIKLFFSEQLKEESINSFTVIMRCGEEIMPVQLSYSPLERAVVVYQKKDLAEGEKCTVTVTNGITDTAGNGLENPKSYFFYVGNPVDRTAPRAVLLSPEPNSRKIGTNAIICATFSGEIDQRSLNQYTFFVRDESRNISGRVSYNSALKRVEFFPETTLARGKIYTATLTKGIRGANGIPVNDTVSWNFTVIDYDQGGSL
ncbi:MAG: Ig-like domain-containing protein [Candidatus Wallbacteria bacterium]|nr:Ig-like domain-containing protein [Candidatus Wallbacteria bacterium]